VAPGRLGDETDNPDVGGTWMMSGEQEDHDKHFNEVLTPGQSGYWVCTPQLRWFHRRDVIERIGSVTIGKNRRVLQQLWQGSDGTQKWEDVPEEQE
jgi:hypothetical protein